MIKRINILRKSEFVFAEKVKKEIIDLLNKNRVNIIEISRTTSNYLNKILSIIGEEYNDIINIVPDKKLSFGVIRFKSSTNSLNGIRTPIFNNCNSSIDKDFTLIVYSPVVDTKIFDETLVMENPKYLIMCRNTLSMLIDCDSDNLDDYQINDKAFYHSYKKTPIAICEFLEPGEIDLVTE